MARPIETTKTIIMKHLEDLDKKQFKKFCSYLTERKEEPRVRKSAVEDKDQLDIADLLVRTFTEDAAAKVTTEILRAIECNDIAEALENKVGQHNSSRAVEGSKEHFVDKYQPALIARVSCVEPILDRLLQKKVLNDESYSNIMSKPTSQEKMRALLHGPLRTSGAKGKDVFYDVLNELETYLVEDLKGVQ